MAVQSRIVLEPSAEDDRRRYMTAAVPRRARAPAPPASLDDLQAVPIEKPPVEEEWITVPAAVGEARVRMSSRLGALGRCW